MKQTIRFKGLSLNKDEMSAEHGELSLCGNLELHDGALRPYQVDGAPLAGGRPLEYSFLDQNDDVVETVICEMLYVHVTAAYTHYISIARSTQLNPNVAVLCASFEEKTSYQLYTCKVGGADRVAYSTDSGTTWKDAVDDSAVTPDTGTTPEAIQPAEYLVRWNTSMIDGFDASDIRSIKSVGNTLCIMKGDGLHYILCKNVSNGWSYKYLGQQPSFIELQYKINNSATDDRQRNTEEFDLVVSENDWWGPTTGNNGIKDSVRGSITEQVLAAVNRRIDTCLSDKRFYAPFLIRYCYRMYDGSMIMHSAPVMLIPMLSSPVITWIKNARIADGLDVDAGTFLFCVYLRECTLGIRWLGDVNTIDAELQEWSDIIKSVDFFATPQFSRIDTAAMIEDICDSSEYTDGSVCFFDETIADDFYRDYPGMGTSDSDKSFVLPEAPVGDYYDRMRKASSFFKVKSVQVEDLKSVLTDDQSVDGFVDFEYDVSSLKSVEVQEQMKDDYKTHNLLLPETGTTGGLYVYNHRLNVYGLSEKIFKGFSPAIMFPWKSDSDTAIYTVDVFVNTPYGTRKVTYDCGETPAHIDSWYLRNGFCFYPDSRAAYMIFREVLDDRYVRKLSDHPMMNGAESFMTGLCSFDPVDVLDDDVVPMPNKIYTSKADNPFYFPNLPGESGINSVGTGEIIGIAAVTRPLVQGEVGKQNLVVFATDGIWVCEVSSTGTYSSMRNISREVCVNQESICQMDQSILFATNRSLSRFVESDVVSVSDVLDGPIFDIKNKMAAFDAYANTITLSWGAKLSSLTRFATPPLDFFREGKELYDYTGMRVIVFPKEIASGGVSLVYSIRDGAWSTIMFPALKTVINSYPSPYIQRSDGGVFCLNQAYDYKAQYATYGVIVTRTLSFSDTMDVLRGFRQYTDSAAMPLMFFYGSNDQRNWKYIGETSREYYNYLPGHPYRFFRICIFMNMYPSEEYQALELETVNKYAKL